MHIIVAHPLSCCTCFSDIASHITQSEEAVLYMNDLLPNSLDRRYREMVWVKVQASPILIHSS